MCYALSVKNALLVIVNLFVSLFVAKTIGVVTLGVGTFVIALAFRISDFDAIFFALLLALATGIGSFITSSWIFASHFARDVRRGHLAVVWGIPTIAVAAFLTWFFGTAPRR